MSGDIKSISIQEAEAAKKMIRDQSEIAKEAIRRVRHSPDMLPNWQGNRRRRFDEAVVSEMQKLEQVIAMVDQAAECIQIAITRFVEADS
jgi:hypothetical protein